MDEAFDDAPKPQLNASVIRPEIFLTNAKSAIVSAVVLSPLKVGSDTRGGLVVQVTVGQVVLAWSRWSSSVGSGGGGRSALGLHTALVVGVLNDGAAAGQSSDLGASESSQIV